MHIVGSQQRKTQNDDFFCNREKTGPSHLILNSVGTEVLGDLLEDLLQLYGASAAVLERDGHWALGLISSSWCHFLNEASRNLCGAVSAKKAIKCGKWLCRESCRHASLGAIEAGHQKEVKCPGGMYIYAVPIRVWGEIIGAISLSYGDPPADYEKLEEIALLYGVNVNELQLLANSYSSSPPFMLDIAKKRMFSASKMISEIVKRSLAEEALRKSKHFVNQVVETTPNLLYIYDLVQKRNIYANRKTGEFLGYSPEELQAMGDSLYERIFHPDDIPLVENHHKALAHDNSDEVRELEYRVRHSSGEWRWLCSHDVVFERNARGLVTQILGTAQDITRRKHIEEALRESEASYRALAENLPAIVYRLFPHKKHVQFFNEMLNHVTGYSPDELPYEGFCCVESLVLSADRTQLVDAVKTAVEERKPFEIAYRLRDKNGIIRHCLERGRPIFDDAGQLLHIEGVIFDITEHKRLADQLRQAQKMEAIGTLAGGIAHDFNNILATILTYSEIALRELTDDHPIYEDLNQVVELTHRARDLVKQILAFSRQTEDEKKHPLRIGSIIKEALRLLRASLPSTIEIRQKIMSKEDVALIDPTQIHQVLINLCTNAAHAMREKGGILEVGLTKIKLNPSDVVSCPDLKPGQYLKLTVSDTGHGMDPDTMRQIFDPYFTTKESGEGTGLGLAVVHGIVKRHEGGIRVRSKVGEGSTFEVLFPVVDTIPQPNTDPAHDMPGGNERILLVDDEEALLEGRRRIFEKLGYQVVARRNGLEALEVFRAQPHFFDLVVTDYTMPHMTGIDMAKEIIRIRPEIPIVLCTGGGTADSIEKAQEIGISEIATKPIRLGDLARMVRNALDRGGKRNGQ